MSPRSRRRPARRPLRIDRLEARDVPVATVTGLVDPVIGTLQQAAGNPANWYRADGTLQDSGSAGVGLTAQGGVVFAPGEIGQAFSLDGSTGYLAAGTALLGTGGSFSVDAWINPTNAAIGYQDIVSEIGQENAAGQYQLRLDPSGAVTFFRRTGSGSLVDGFTTTNPIASGAWTHVAAVYSAGTGFTIFVNGVPQAGSTFTNGNYSSGVPVQTFIGTNDSLTEHFGGRIDELGFYKRALSNSDVQAVMEIGHPGTFPAGATSLQITFDEAVIGADQAVNYQLQAAGPDGLLGTADDTIVNVSPSYSGTTATLAFAALPADVYRLTVKAGITDGSGNPLDGDGDGNPGGDYMRDVVVMGVPPTPLTSPDGFNLDPQMGGPGAGQLVQGTANAFDGSNRLLVAGAEYGPAAATTPGVTVAQAAGSPEGWVSVPAWQTVSNLTLTFTSDGSPVRLESSLDAAAYSANSGWLQFRFAVDGVGRAPVGNRYFPTAIDFDQFDLSDWVTGLAPGPHTVSLQALAGGGGQYYFAANGNDPATPSISAVQFEPFPSPVMANGGQSVITPTQTLSGLQVSRSITVPNTGSQDFARTVDTFTNPTGSDVTAPVTILGNLGSDAATTVFATSDGDTTPDPSDEWVGTSGGSSPAVVEIIHGPYGLKPTSVQVVGDNIEWTYNLTVPAGQTVRLATFTVVANTQAAAVAAADTLMQPGGFGGNAAEFLSASDVASLANVVFDTPPTTTGTIPDVSVSEDAAASVLPLRNYFADAEDGASGLTYTVQSVTGTAGLFSSTSVDPATGNLTLNYADGAVGSDAVTIRATDTKGLFVDSTFNATVSPVDDPPTLGAIGDLHINEDAPQQTVNLTGLSPGPADEAGQSLTITATSDNPALIPDPTVNYTAGDTTGTLSFQALLASGSATVTVTVQDNGGTANGGSDTVTRTFTVYVNPEPVRPVVDTSFTPLLPAIKLPIKNGTFPPAAPIGLLGAHTTNPDAGDPKGVALAGVDPAAGRWQYTLDGGATWTNVPAVSPTGALLLSGNANTALRLLPGPGFKNKYTDVSYRAWDQSNGKAPGTLDDVTNPAATAYSQQTEQAWVAVGKPKPVVDAAGDPELTPTRPLKEDHASPAYTVKKFLGLLGLAEKEADPTKTYGIAVSGDSGGTWEFNVGQGWQPIGSVSDSTALLLRPTDKVKYLPTLNFNGTATLTYHTWDQTSGSAGSTADTAGAGFSAQTETAILTVAPMNDPPVLDTTQHPDLGTAAAGQPTAAVTVSNFLAGMATDVDSPSIGIELLPASSKVGVWQYSTDAGTTWQAATKPTELDATVQIRFLAAAGAKAGTYSVSFKAWDGTARGGTSLSKATGAATVEIG